ncbi:hypothetical protein OESDEN_03164 [Oesophagostomum dentatum]|uniref:Uncharacterized protein n=1 Tax=Oesophagostomum dentatum TaxID=61180 RepID=A0A0B1THW8_OESDE|nr:hypothetical protein OESDEN_03164 [Oesophagostomum dentatum]
MNKAIAFLLLLFVHSLSAEDTPGIAFLFLDNKSSDFSKVMQQNPYKVAPLLIGAGIVGLILFVIATAKLWPDG